MSNSDLFEKLLYESSKMEKVHPTFPMTGLKTTVVGFSKVIAGDIVVKPVKVINCLPYIKLRNLFLEDDAGLGWRVDPVLRRFLNRLPKISEFSVMQIINGCATALRFEENRPNLTQIIRTARAERDGHLIQKNPAKGAGRAERRSVAALVLEPSISNAMRSQSDGDELIEITLRKFGCAYYPQDRLQCSKQPSTVALLAFNLEYIFRRWPIEEGTFPSYPPKKRPRDQQPAIAIGMPRLDLVAYLVSTIFPPDDESYSVDQIKSILNKMRSAKAVFVGW